MKNLLSGALFFVLAGFAMASPPVTSGLRLHFDASNIDAVANSTLLDGQTVAEWKDLSGNGYHLDTPVGAPTYIQPGPGFGGLPVVAFQPNDFNGPDFLSKKASPITNYPFTVLAVVRSNTAKNSVIFSLVHEASFDRMAGLRFVSEGVEGPGRLSLFRRNPDWIETPTTAVFNDNSFHIVTASFLSSNLARLYVDGQLLATSTSHVTLPAFDRFDIGNTGRRNGTTDPYEGQIAEILVYDRELQPETRTANEDYLSQKWITGKSGVTATETTLDFGSVALGEEQTRTTILTNSGAPDGVLNIQSIETTFRGEFAVRAFLNQLEFDPTDTSIYPITLSRIDGDELKFEVKISPTETLLNYNGSIVVSSDADNQPELSIAFKAHLRDRLGAPDYLSHEIDGNHFTFHLQGEAETRITLNTAAMARIQYSPDGIYRPDNSPDHFMVQQYDWDPVSYRLEDHGSYIGIHTEEVTIRAQKSPFRIQMYDAENLNLIVKDSDSEGMYTEQEQRGVKREENGSGHGRFGFGSGDHGHSRPLNKSAGYEQFTVTHGRTCVPFFMSTAGYGIFLNTIEKDTSFDEEGGFETAHFLDYWYMSGDFKEILALHSRLTGKMNLLPKWAYGFMLSKYGNDNATQTEFSEWINRLRDEDYPTDSYVFDYGWRGSKFSPHRWDPERFPDLPAMFVESKQLGFHIGLHNNKGTPEAGNGNFADPDIAENWWQAHWSEVIEPGYGDWFWPDEFDVSGDNLMANLSAKTIHERWLEETTEQRPMFFTRGGFANHHFASTWSGDIPNTINEMSQQITGTLALGLSGYPWSAHDLGGFFTKPSDELYIRWVAQFGAFNGIMRAHGHDGREPWLYSQQAQDNLRKYLKVRYRLLPYIYTTAWQGSELGLPMMRAMALEHPTDPVAWTVDKQYYFGDWLLVVPALATKETHVSVWLPDGTWYDYFQPSVTYQGGQTLSISTSLDQIPVFVKEGAIIPSGPELSYADEKPLNPLTVDVYPGPDATSYTLYEDDGVTRSAMLEDASCKTTYTTTWAQQNLLRFTKEAMESGNPESYLPELPRATLIRANQWTQKPSIVILGNEAMTEATSLAALPNLDKGWFWSAAEKRLHLRFIDDGSKVTLVASEQLVDSDGDGLSDLEEAQIGSDIYQADSDGDGQSDFSEVQFGTSFNDASSQVYLGYEILADEPDIFRIYWPSVPGNRYQVNQWQESSNTWTMMSQITATQTLSQHLYPMRQTRALLRVEAN